MKSNRYQEWKLILVALPDDELSAASRENIEEICRNELAGCKPNIVDASDPAVLKKYGIFAIPTLIRESPEPVKKIIGTLSNRQIVMQELGLRPRKD